MFIKGKFNYLAFIDANILFAFCFVATENISSPNTKQGMTLYGGIIGLLTVIFNSYLNAFAGPYLAIFLASFGAKLGEKKEKKLILGKKYQKNKGNRL